MIYSINIKSNFFYIIETKREYYIISILNLSVTEINYFVDDDTKVVFSHELSDFLNCWKLYLLKIVKIFNIDMFDSFLHCKNL
jgi:hypothetical protein